jgi:DNA polymerase
MTEFEPSPAELTPQTALRLLSFHVDAGANEAFCDEPQNRFQQPGLAEAAQGQTADAPPPEVGSAKRAPLASRAMAEAPASTFRAMPQTIAIDDAEMIAAARALAAEATSLEALRAAIARFEGCALANTAKNLVFQETAAGARVMLIGDAPHRDEDLEGRPFAGEQGRLLDRMLAAIGLERSDVYLSHLLPWRPPGDRSPTPSEQAICMPFVIRQIELCAPALLVFAGGVAAKHLLGVDTPLPKLRGQWKDYKIPGGQIPALTMFAPDYLLRHPAHKRYAWQDLLSLKARLENLPPP